MALIIPMLVLLLAILKTRKELGSIYFFSFSWLFCIFPIACGLVEYDYFDGNGKGKNGNTSNS